jgi:hypothetical protein
MLCEGVLGPLGMEDFAAKRPVAGGLGAGEPAARGRGGFAITREGLYRSMQR